MTIFCSSFVIICAERLHLCKNLPWRCKVAVVAAAVLGTWTENEMSGIRFSREIFDWSLVVPSVVNDAHWSQSASLHWHLVETPQMLCIHAFLSQKTSQI